ncbi:hypothetical protein TrVE_jg13776 [Triparma verrucosa]|uniref:DNA polymerase delta small subunit n=1 Tax=Triparma verrucosa TaxID=1606542 RepID=A0A9W7C756_9STRA|nr:hypothetical protein TrVE_jg13776 [Triparma verrucosa]
MTQPVTASRASAPFTPTWQKFKLTGKQYAQQYSHIYSKRLLAQGPMCLPRASKAFPQATAVPRIIELKESVRSIVVGTLVKESSNRVEVQGGLSEDAAIVLDNSDAMKVKAFKTMSDDKDKCVLEDDSGRLALKFLEKEDMFGYNYKVRDLVTGVVVAIVGVVDELGEMEVEAIFVGGIEQGDTGDRVKEEIEGMTKATVGDETSQQPPVVMLASGLQVGKSGGDMLPLQLLVDYISGSLCGGDAASLLGSGSGANVARVLIAGGATGSTFFTSGDLDEMDVKKAAEPIKVLDEYLSQICCNVEVDLMPGASDPVPLMLPQGSIHPCLLPKSGEWQSLNCTPNPYSARVGGAKFLGTSGQPLADMRRFTSSSQAVTMSDTSNDGAPVAITEMEALESTLNFRHLTPTGPDSLPTYPFQDQDPFVIGKNDVPHVLFAGGCEKFETKVVAGVRLVCVPDFDSTKEVVLVNLENFECEVVKFEVS